MLIKWVKEKIKDYKISQHSDLIELLEQHNELNKKVLNLYNKVLSDKQAIKDLEISYKFLQMNHIKESIEERKKILLTDRKTYKEEFEKLQRCKNLCNELIEKYKLKKYLKNF